jgi:hypothetical protein
MTRTGLPLATLGFAFTLWLGITSRSAAAAPADQPPTFANLQGEVVLDNPRVTVEKFVLQPGQTDR